jgi:hypothetical protein
MARGDSIDPRGKLRLAAKVAKAAEDGDEDILGSVFTFLDGNTERGGESMHQGRVPVVEAAPGGYVAGTA